MADLYARLLYSGLTQTEKNNIETVYSNPDMTKVHVVSKISRPDGSLELHFGGPDAVTEKNRFQTAIASRGVRAAADSRAVTMEQSQVKTRADAVATGQSLEVNPEK